MRGYYDLINKLHPDQVLDYLRKSRTDDPTMTVEEVLVKHEAILDEWAEKNLGSKVPNENKYREIVSGETIADRPEIQKLLKRIESPKIRAIKIVDVQRLSRGDLEDAGRLIKLLRYTNTLVITPQKIYDLSDEYDRDSFERELKRGNEYLEYSKRIMSNGRLLAVSQGHFIGNYAPYGYDKTWYMEGKRKVHTLAINEKQATVVQLIYELYVNEDMGMYHICNHLDGMGIQPPKGSHWSPPAVRDMLSNVHYIGKVKWNHRKTITVVEDSEIIKIRPRAKQGDYLIYDGKHEAIISEELFYAAQEKHGKNARVKPNKSIANPLAGLVSCHCGRAMTLRTYKKADGSERCAPRLICDNQKRCNTGSCTYEEVEQVVVNTLKQCIADFELRIKNADSDSVKLHEKLLKSLEQKMQDLEAKELAQWEAQANPDASQRMPAEIFKKLNEKLLREKEETRDAIRNAQQSMPHPADYAEKIVMFSNALSALQDSEKSAQEKNKLLKACIEKIEYKRERPTRLKQDFKKARQWTEPTIEITIKMKV